MLSKGMKVLLTQVSWESGYEMATAVAFINVVFKLAFVNSVYVRPSE